MTHREKVKLLIADLSARGVNSWTTAPPLWRLAWAFGIELTPPHFIDSRTMAVVGGSIFGPVWALVMRYFFWREQNLLILAAAGVTTGVLFGRILAKRYGAEAERLHLPPSWERYPGG